MQAEHKGRSAQAATLHRYEARCLLAREQVFMRACFHVLDPSGWSFKKMQCITRFNSRHTRPLRRTSVFQSQTKTDEQMHIWWFAMFRLIATHSSLVQHWHSTDRVRHGTTEGWKSEIRQLCTRGGQVDTSRGNFVCRTFLAECAWISERPQSLAFRAGRFTAPKDKET